MIASALLLLLFAQQPEPGAVKADPILQPVTDTPGLPRVLLIGDSISMGYTLGVRAKLAGKANVHRVLENGGPTINGTAKIDQWLGDTRWDVVHFNFGLHDLKREDGMNRQVPPEDYERNLREIVRKIKSKSRYVIWASTTPVPEGKVNPHRVPADVPLYNSIAAKVMKDERVPVNDLYALTLPNLATWQRPVNVHFVEAGSEALARQVAAILAKTLQLKN
jgi:lysophospholipase L1-like esterase